MYRSDRSGLCDASGLRGLLRQLSTSSQKREQPLCNGAGPGAIIPHMTSTDQGRLLIVDDHATHLRTLCDVLALKGYQTRGYTSGAEALEALTSDCYDVLITDLRMPDMDGITLTRSARLIDPDLAAIIMTGHGTIDTAIRALQGGAMDYVLKPFSMDSVKPIIDRAVSIRRLGRENALLRERERQRSEELAATNRALESFSYSISHDLKAPLRAVSSLVQIVREDYDERLDDEGRGVLKLIGESCDRMDELITGLLAFSQSTRQPLDRAPVDMRALACVAWNEVLAVHQGPAPELDIPALPPAYGDATLLRQVWCNLLGNAVKYSAKRPDPAIRIRGRYEGQESVYEVADNGAGFDMKYAHRLFDVFQRLHRPEDFAGTGVGLAIVQRIVTRHGGRIWAEGSPNAGASFHFALPMVSVETQRL
jgi:signal transduction histidine kinase